MSDYIERDLLLAEIKELKKSPWYNGGYGTYERNIRREAIDYIVDLCIRQLLPQMRKLLNTANG